MRLLALAGSAPIAAAADDYVGIDLPMPEGVQIRDYQVKQFNDVQSGWREYSRQLGEAATGTGKTALFSLVTAAIVKAGGRVLILAHTEELLEQAQDKLMQFTGLESDLEKAEDRASLEASVVIASVQTLQKDSRLLSFPDDHFALVIVDECHRIMSPSYQKIVCYFHFGEVSLEESWRMPEPGFPFKYKARVLGVTATSDRGDGRNLGTFFQHRAFRYGIKEAVLDGYLVRPTLKTLPLKIDVSNVHLQGKDLNATEIAERLNPLLEEIARQVAIEASNRKTIIWLPSVDSARQLAKALQLAGLAASFVSGACDDRESKIEDFRRAGRGTVICNAMLLTEGVDIADVDCACMLRPTRIRSLMVQAYGRATRVLPGVIDGLATAAERRAAIATSDKPDMLIIDFLWHHDRLALASPVEFVTGRPEVRDLMTKADTSKATDLMDLEAGATRDLLQSLENAARRHANKQARVFDPLALAEGLGDTELALWQPSTEWDALPATDKQLAFLQSQGIDTSGMVHRGLAREWTIKILKRLEGKLATPRQLHFLRQLGVALEDVRDLTIQEANMAADLRLADLRDREAEPTVAEPAP